MTTRETSFVPDLLTGEGSRTARIGLLVALLVVLPFALPFVELGTEIAIFAIALVGLDLLVGYTGLVSFGHAAYFGAGAYSVALLTSNLIASGSVILTLGAVIVVVAVVSVIFGYISLKRTGVYFAMLTLALAELLYFISLQFDDLTGGTDGLVSFPSPTLAILEPIVGAPVELSGLAFYGLAAVVFLLAFLVARRLASSPFGLILLTIRENEERARFLGYNTGRYKLAVFTISGIYAGIAGALLALENGSVSLSMLHWSLSGDMLIMLILGGMGTIFGAGLGALVVILLQELLSAEFVQTYQFFTGMIFILFVLFLPKGIWNIDRETLALGRQRAASIVEQLRER
jgi:branched-chain amino acid transport system permease protein